MKRSVLSSILRGVTFVLLSLAALFTLLGGIGTTCVAFAAENWESMAALVPVKPVFQVLVVISIAAAVYGILAIVRLGKSKPAAYRDVLIFLVVGLVTSAIQYYFSLTLRGKTAPNNVRLYVTVLALIVFLLLRLPPAWKASGFGQNSSGKPSVSGPTGMALLLCGLVTLTTPLWAAPTHLLNGENTVSVLLPHLLAGGIALILAGCWTLFARRKDSRLAERGARLLASK